MVITTSLYLKSYAGPESALSKMLYIWIFAQCSMYVGRGINNALTVLLWPLTIRHQVTNLRVMKLFLFSCLLNVCIHGYIYLINTAVSTICFFITLSKIFQVVSKPFKLIIHYMLRVMIWFDTFQVPQISSRNVKKKICSSISPSSLQSDEARITLTAEFKTDLYFVSALAVLTQKKLH